MFRKIALLLSAVLVFSANPLSAASVKPLLIVKAIPADQDIAGMLVGNSAIYLFGNTPTGGYVTALNKDGSQIWNHSFSDLTPFTISSGALDASGNIWLAGAAASPIAISDPAVPSPGAVNPDGVIIGTEGAVRPDLTNLTLWKISATGSGAGKYQLALEQPVLPTSLNINKSGISVVAWQPAGSLFVSADLAGKFGKPLKIGKTNTTLDKVIRNSDGTSILLGSGTELFLKNKAIGVRDGLIIKVDATPKIIQSVRSGEKSASRNWASGTSSLLFGGYLKSPTSSLATVTKFTASLQPTWSARYKATSSAIVANGVNGSFYAAYENSGSATLLYLDKNGKTIGSYSFTGQPIALEDNKTFGTYVFTGTTIYTVSTK